MGHFLIKMIPTQPQSGAQWPRISPTTDSSFCFLPHIPLGADCHKASDALTITSLYTHHPRDALWKKKLVLALTQPTKAPGRSAPTPGLCPFSTGTCDQMSPRVITLGALVQNQLGRVGNQVSLPAWNAGAPVFRALRDSWSAFTRLGGFLSSNRVCGVIAKPWASGGLHWNFCAEDCLLWACQSALSPQGTSQGKGVPHA